jgi:hypothetical protein
MKVKYFTLPTHSLSFDHELPTSGHEPTSKDIFDNRRGRERERESEWCIREVLRKPQIIPFNMHSL